MAFDHTPANDGKLLSLWKGEVAKPRWHPEELDRLDVMMALDLHAKRVPIAHIAAQTGLSEPDLNRILAYREPQVDPRPAGGMMGIARTVAARWGMSVDALRSCEGRRQDQTWPRHEFMWRARSYTRPARANGREDHCYSTPQIGGWFLRPMNHASVIHGVREFQRRLLSGEIEAFREKVTGGRVDV